MNVVMTQVKIRELNRKFACLIRVSIRRISITSQSIMRLNASVIVSYLVVWVEENVSDNAILVKKESPLNKRTTFGIVNASVNLLDANESRQLAKISDY